MTTFKRADDAHDARAALVQVFADAVFQELHVHGAFGLGDADELAEIADGFRRVTAPAQPGERGHARIVPAAHEAFRDQFQQITLAQHRVRQVQPREFDLLRPVDAQFDQEPVVERPVDFKLQGADGVRDAFDGIAEAVGPVVGRVDEPLVAGAVVRGAHDAVHHRVAHVDVGRGHVNFGAERLGAVREFARAHALEEVQVLLRCSGCGTGFRAPAARRSCRPA